MPKTIAIDFDGVINSYTSGWTEGRLPDPPNPGALDFIREMRRTNHEVVIFSSRAKNGRAVAQIKRWLESFGLEATHTQAIRITNRKPPAVIYLDDRAVRFTGTFPTAAEVDALAEAPGKDPLNIELAKPAPSITFSEPPANTPEPEPIVVSEAGTSGSPPPSKKPRKRPSKRS
jgi:hypothetical protein